MAKTAGLARKDPKDGTTVITPESREVIGTDGTVYIVELMPLTVTIRPKGTRKGGPAEGIRTWAQLYLDCHGGASLRANGRRKR